jgi:hypothetical protein
MGVIPRPDLTNPPPLARTDLPALAVFHFEGHSEYLEQVLARIDAPSLHHLTIFFSFGPVASMSQLCRFITNIEGLKKCQQATVELSRWSVTLTDGTQNHLKLGSSWGRLGSRISSTAQVLDHLLSRAESLVIHSHSAVDAHWQRDMELTQWLALLRPFAAVAHLSVSLGLVPIFAHVLRGLTGERDTEVLPALRRLTFVGRDHPASVKEAIKVFLAARQLSDRPVALEYWV